jgi:hypothetical protein
MIFERIGSQLGDESDIPPQVSWPFPGQRRGIEHRISLTLEQTPPIHLFFVGNTRPKRRRLWGTIDGRLWGAIESLQEPKHKQRYQTASTPEHYMHWRTRDRCLYVSGFHASFLVDRVWPRKNAVFKRPANFDHGGRDLGLCWLKGIRCWGRQSGLSIS